MCSSAMAAFSLSRVQNESSKEEIIAVITKVCYMIDFNVNLCVASLAFTLSFVSTSIGNRKVIEKNESVPY